MHEENVWDDGMTDSGNGFHGRGKIVCNTTILICENDRTKAEDLKGRLVTLGFTIPIMVVSSAEVASAALEPSGFVLLLAAVPCQGSLEAVELLEQRTSRAAIGLICMIDGSRTGSLEPALSMNPHGVLVKPFSDEQLAATVLTALNVLGITRLPMLDTPVSEGLVKPANLGASNPPDTSVDRGGGTLAVDDTTPADVVPICSGCKQIREGDGSWTQIERYLIHRYNLWFTHTLCPECLKIYLNWTRELSNERESGSGQ